MKYPATKAIFKLYTRLMVCLVFLVAIGCSNSDGDSGGKREFLSVGTAPPGGSFFPVGQAIVQAVQANVGDLPWQISAEATKGTQENIRRLISSELDFAMANAAISYFAVRGAGAWKKEFPIRTVMTLAPNVALFITPKSSGITKISDLKGKRVVVGPAGAGFEYFVEPILKAHGVAWEDFQKLNGTQAATVDLLADGNAAAAFLGGAIPTASITQASASQNILFVPFEEEAKEKLYKDYPFFHPAKIPAGTYRGQTEDFEGMNVGSTHFITYRDQDEETVYRFTKILYEHREEVVKQHPSGRAINATNIVKDTGTPFHPGAIRYYKELGIWPEAEEAGSGASE